MLKRIKEGLYTYKTKESNDLFYLIESNKSGYKLYVRTDYNRLHYITTTKYLTRSIDTINEYVNNNLN